MCAVGNVRRPVVAGSFYPADSERLRARVQALLEEATRRTAAVDDRVQAARAGRAPVALVAPHAGYVYSGPVAASAYLELAPYPDHYRRVVLMGPSHRVPFRGLALTKHEGFETPLGIVEVDREAVGAAHSKPGVLVSDQAHRFEHSLEAQLPFLQVVLGEDFSIVPVVVGRAQSDEVAGFLEPHLGEPETLVLVSTDLSHYHDYETARKIDRATGQAVESLKPEAIGSGQACGGAALRGLLTAARRRSMSVALLDLRNSGDITGERDQVVGYGAFVVRRE